MPVVNDYPAYYRLNRAASVLCALYNLGFSSVTFHYYPCLQWDHYFPKYLRCFPHLYEYFLGTRFRLFMQIFAFRLQKGEVPRQGGPG